MTTRGKVGMDNTLSNRAPSTAEDPDHIMRVNTTGSTLVEGSKAGEEEDWLWREKG